MPTVLSRSSTPVYLLRFHGPVRSESLRRGDVAGAGEEQADGELGGAETMFDVGALTTMTPACVAAGTSTLSRPTPARATTLSRCAAASASASIFVAERISTASTSAMAGEQRRTVGAVAVADLEVGAERVDGRGDEFLGDQDDGLGHARTLPTDLGSILEAGTDARCPGRIDSPSPAARLRPTRRRPDGHWYGSLASDPLPAAGAVARTRSDPHAGSAEPVGPGRSAPRPRERGRASGASSGASCRGSGRRRPRPVHSSASVNAVLLHGGRR